MIKKMIKISCILILISSFLIFYQTISLYPALQKPLNETLTQSFENVNIEYIKLNNKKIKTVFIGDKKTNNLLIYFHGNYELIDDNITKFKNISDNLNVSVLMVEYNGYGSSEGIPSLKSTTNNVKKILESMFNNKEILNKNLIIYGRSIGTAHALNFSNEYTEYVDHIILQSGFILPLNAITDNKTITKILNIFFIENYDSLEKINNISNKKTLKSSTIIHGNKDKLFNIKYGKQLRDEFIKNNIETVYIEYDGGHNSFNFSLNEIIKENIN